MPHDLFGDVVARRPTRTRFRRVLTVTSIVVHAIVISSIVVVQVFAIGPLPVPHRPLIFEELRFVKLIEIPLPPAPRKATSDPSPTVSLDAAPIVMPTAITEETGREGMHTPATTAVPGVDLGPNGIDSLSTGVFGSVAPPPPPPPPVNPIRVHAGMQAPVKVVNVDPIYPPIAQQARVQGVVILEAIIDERGAVKTASILRSIPLLDAAALDAVRQWRFTPARLNGEAVPVVMTVTVRFTLDH
jgi:protein TonB